MSKPTGSAVLRWQLLAILAGLLAGCARETPPVAAASGKIQLSIGDRAAYDALLNQRRGQVVLVDFWAHWCEPCVENFPHIMEVGRQYRENGLAVVTVNMDAPEAAEKTLDFLTSQRAGIATHLISQYGGGSHSMETFEIPGGALPCYKVYDRTGRLRHTFALNPAAQRQFTLQELDAAVEMLLAE